MRVVAKVVGKEVKAYNGAMAAAWAHVWARTRVVICYPITPASNSAEYLQQLAADDRAEIEVRQLEGELSAAAAAIACAKTRRTADFSGGNGLTYKMEVLPNAPGGNVPYFLDVCSRNPGGNINIWGDFMDLYSLIISGYLMLVSKNNQRTVDLVPLGFALAEDPQVRTPIMVIKRGFDGSHVVEPTMVLDQEKIDAFLPPFQSRFTLFDPKNPLAYGSMLYPGSARHGGGEWTRHRVLNCQWGLDNAKEVFVRNWRKYQKLVYGPDWRGLEDEFYIPHDGLFDWHGPEKAKKVIITMGTDGETAELVNRNYLLNTEIKDTAVVTVNLFHPYPGEELVKALQKAGVEAVGVVDQALPYNWGGSYHKLLVENALSTIDWQTGGRPKVINFIGGVGGDELTPTHFQIAFNVLQNVQNGAPYEKVYYFGFPERSILGTEESMEWMAGHLNPNVRRYFKQREEIYKRQPKLPQFHPDLDPVFEIEETAIHGFGGEGNVLAAALTAQAAVEAGVETGAYVCSVPLFGSAKTGQYVNVTNIHSLGRVGIRKGSGQPHHSIVYNMAVFDEELGPGKWILATTRDNLVLNTGQPLESVEKQLREIYPESRAKLWKIDADRLALEAGSDYVNMFMFGAALRINKNLNHETVLKYLESRIKPEMMNQVRQGYNAVTDREEKVIGA